ncbi:hypothetical protein DMI69_14845 [Escherichia coli]|nr:hypothetical protein [Escherichia coli]
MIQPISGPPPGNHRSGDNLPSGAGNQPLSSQQRTSLESLMTKVTSLTQQQRAELWRVSGTILVCREIHRCFRVTSLPLSIIWRNVCWPRRKAILPASF